jgi:putative tryptophan/tyrosine transport system substrate-binding protein
MFELRRRDAIWLLGGIAACPSAAAAQQADHIKRVGWIAGVSSNDREGQARLTAFREALAALGWIEGRNVEIIARFGTAEADRNRAAVAELLRMKLDAIVTSNPLTVSLLMQETRTIPIIFTMQPDPIGQGFVSSLARPGGNVTGFTSVEQSMAGKWLELLTEVAPEISRVAMLIDPNEPGGAMLARALESSASGSAVVPMTALVHDDTELAQAIELLGRKPKGGLIMPPSAWLAARRALVIELTARNRVPAIYAYPYLVAEGALMSYGPDVLDLFRRSASYVDRILKGAKPSDLPIQQPTKFELAVNLRTAKALGLTIPESFLLRADQVIE